MFKSTESSVDVMPSSYSIDESPNNDYEKNLSNSCSGIITAGEYRICTLTNNDN
jgi:hypothetical protein